MFSRAAQFREGAEALPWILTITSFECKTHLKKIGRRRENFTDVFGMSQTPSKLLSADDAISQKEHEEALHACLGELQQSDRDALMSAYFGAAAPNINAATLRKRVQRAIVRLKTAWSMSHD